MSKISTTQSGSGLPIDAISGVSADNVQDALLQLKTQTDAKADNATTQAALNLKYDASNPSGYQTVAQVTSTVSAASTADRDRANHTGTQLASTISDFSEAVDDRVATLLTAGTNITLTYNDVANTLTIDSTGGGGGSYTDEQAQDAVGTILTDTASVDFTYNDVANTISAAVLPAGVDHNSLQNYTANRHIDHTTVSISAGAGLSGGGDITANRTISMPDVGTASTYGSASQVPVLTTDAKGRITGVVNTAISIVAAAVSDFADAVRSTVLTGLSLTTGTAVTAADTVLQAIGKLQAQLNKTTISRVQGTLTNSSSVTLVNMTALSFPVVAGRWYAFETVIEYSSAVATTGAAWSMTGSGGVAGTITATGSFQTSTNANQFIPISGIGTVITSTAVPSAGTLYIGKIYGVFTCTTSGTLTPAFRSETNGQTISVYNSTFITVRDIT